MIVPALVCPAIKLVGFEKHAILFIFFCQLLVASATVIVDGTKVCNTILNVAFEHCFKYNMNKIYYYKLFIIVQFYVRL